ncbi:MAG TPA: hypothetical protein VGC79_22630 [Polyangiaceae bacterium]
MLSGRFGVCVAGALFLHLLATPAHAEPPNHQHKQRDEVSPDEIGSMPEGFHLETRPRYGVIIGGAITTGVGGMLLAAGLQQRADCQNSTSSVEGTPGSCGELFLIPGGLALAVGLPLLAYGLLSPREVYVRDPAPLQLGFSADQRHVAAGLTYTF